MKRARIAVLGGTGFVGRHVVNALVNQDREVTVPSRAREHAKPLFLLPRVQVPEVDVRDAAALAAAIRGADAVINLIGVLHESPRASFTRMHVGVAEAAIEACRQNGIRRLIQMSALNADPGGPSAYLRSKGEAEARVAASGLDWTVFQPSVIFGPGDGLFCRFAPALKLLPVLPLARASARFQPVYVKDVAQAFILALQRPDSIGKAYPLVGPKTYSMAELVKYTAKVLGISRLVLPLPDFLGRLQGLTFDALPAALKPFSSDNFKSLAVDSVSERNGLVELGIRPTPLELVVPEYICTSEHQRQLDAYRADR